MRYSLKAVGFDIDGTLYPESMMYLCSIPSFLKDPLLMYHFGRMRRGVRTVSVDKTVLPAGEPKKRFRELQARLILETMGKEVTSGRISSMLSRIDRNIYGTWTRSFSRITPFKGVHDALKQLRSLGLKTGLLSDFPPGIKPRALGVESLVDTICSAEDAGQLKPHPEPFELFAEMIGVEDLSRILYVGNSYGKDIIGAKSAGMRTAFFVQSRRKASDAGFASVHPAADIIFSSYYELPEYVMRLSR